MANSDRPALIHAIAHCRDCNFQNEYYDKAVKEGRKHALKTGHTVDMPNIGILDHYVSLIIELTFFFVHIIPIQ